MQQEAQGKQQLQSQKQDSDKEGNEQNTEQNVLNSNEEKSRNEEGPKTEGEKELEERLQRQVLQIKKEKKAKRKKIKKILKERLNIDCLRMLCDMSGDEEQDGNTLKKPMIIDNKSNTASCSVFMREIKRDRDYDIQKAEELKDFD